MTYKTKKPSKSKKSNSNYDNFKIKKGEIIDFSGSWGSGLATMKIKRDDGKVVEVTCDNATTVRSLDRAYGNIIGEGHTSNIDKIKGKRIYYSMTGWDTLEGFQPVEMAREELKSKYKKQFE